MRLKLAIDFIELDAKIFKPTHRNCCAIFPLTRHERFSFNVSSAVDVIGGAYRFSQRTDQSEAEEQMGSLVATNWKAVGVLAIQSLYPS